MVVFFRPLCLLSPSLLRLLLLLPRLVSQDSSSSPFSLFCPLSHRLRLLLSHHQPPFLSLSLSPCDSWLIRPPTLIASPSSTHRCFPTVARAIDIDAFDPFDSRFSSFALIAWIAISGFISDSPVNTCRFFAEFSRCKGGQTSSWSLFDNFVRFSIALFIFCFS